MEKLSEQYLLSNGFSKTDMENNPDLMEFTKIENKKMCIVYLYDEHEVYFFVLKGIGDVDYKVKNINHFEELYKKHMI